MTANVLFDREVEDTAAALLQFECGACGILSVTHAVHEAKDTLDIFCSRGSLHIPVLNESSMKVVTDKGERNESHPPERNFHEPLIKDFVDAVMNNRQPGVGGETGRMVAIIEEEIYRINGEHDGEPA